MSTVKQMSGIRKRRSGSAHASEEDLRDPSALTQTDSHVRAFASRAGVHTGSERGKKGGEDESQMFSRSNSDVLIGSSDNQGKVARG